MRAAEGVDAPVRTAKGRPARPKPEVRASTSDQIVEEIVLGLYDMRYVPGQKLTEADLGKRFGVGRSTVREALKRLAAEGIVTLSLHRTASIRSLSRQETRDTLEVGEALMAAVARLAAERLNRPKDVENLRKAQKAMAEAATARKASEFAQLRSALYRVLAEISGNAELARLIGGSQSHLLRLLRLQFPVVYSRLDSEQFVDCETLVNSVLAKDGAEAERAMRRYVGRIAVAIEALPDEAFDI